MIAARRDKVIVAEVRTTYGQVPVHSSDVVLDLGANIGAASLLFLERGAAKVIAVEPDPRNVLMAKRNLARRKATILWAAVGEKAGRMPFYVSKDKPYLSSAWPDTGRAKVDVPVVTLGALLAQYHPSIVKCDIEFGEYDLPELYGLPDFVRTLAIEFHVRYDLVFKSRTQTEPELREQRETTAALMDSLRAQGFSLGWRKDKQAKSGKIEDETGIGPLVKSIDSVWVR